MSTYEKEIGGVVYNIVPELEKERCTGCAFFDEVALCTHPINSQSTKCSSNKTIFIKQEKIEVEQQETYTIEDIKDACVFTKKQIPTTSVYESGRVEFYVNKFMENLSKIKNPEYKEYLRLKDLFKE